MGDNAESNDFFTFKVNSYYKTISSASLSLVASVILVVMIMKSGPRLSTPYHRIIFALSAGDALVSLAFITGPFSAPEGTSSAPWGVGNTHSCNANAFAKVYGEVAVQLYTVLICLYFYCKLNRKMSNSTFYEKIEKKAHAFIILFTSVVCFSALFTKTFNPLPSGSTCGFSRYPDRCQFTNSCTRGTLGLIYVFLVSFVLVFLCFIGISIFMVLLCIEAYKREKLMRSANPGDEQNSTFLRMFISCFSCNSFRAQRKEDEPLSDYMLRIYKRETFIHALMYISYFAFVHTLPHSVLTLLYLLRRPISRVLASYFGIIYPAMGVFNLLIYTRPKVKILRWAHPNLSWLTAFLLVVKHGGDLNCANDDLKLCCYVPRQRELDRDPMSGLVWRNHDSSSPEIDERGESDEDFSEISRAFALREERERENSLTETTGTA